MGTHVALLRGINVGGKNKLPMKDLVAIFAAAGCTDVATYIQSGNVVCSASAAVAKRLPSAIELAIQKRFGYRIPIMMRTADELARVVRGNPYLAAGKDPGLLHVAFLANAPSAAFVAKLDPTRSPHDEVTVRGRELFLHYPHGVGKSKLTNAYFDKTLATTSTIRNWRTVLALHELAQR